MSDCLPLHGLQHARLPCASLSPGACSNSYPSSWWCHPTMSSSVVPFSSHLQSFPASGFFPMSQFFASSSQSIGVSASVLPMNIQDWFSLGWTGVSLCSRSDSQESPPTTQFESISFRCSAFFIVQLSYPYMTPGKTIALTRWSFTSYSTELNMNYSWFGNWRKRWPLKTRYLISEISELSLKLFPFILKIIFSHPEDLEHIAYSM